MKTRLKLTHKELVTVISNLVLEAQKEIKTIREQNMYSTSDTSPGPLQYLQAVLAGGKQRQAPEGSAMAKQADEYYRRHKINDLLTSYTNKHLITPEFEKYLEKAISKEAKNDPKSLWSITRKLYPKNKAGDPDDNWVSQQVTLEIFMRHHKTNFNLGINQFMPDKSVKPTNVKVKVQNERNNILKSGGYTGLNAVDMLNHLFSKNPIEAAELDAVFSTLVIDDVNLRELFSGNEDFLKWQKNDPKRKEFFSDFPQLTANMGVSKDFSDGIKELLDLYQAPFKNSKEGNAFRNWMNELYPEWRGRGNEPLDRKGSYKNTYINQAWRDYGMQYMDVTKDHELLTYKDWLKKSRLKDNAEMKGYYKDYLKGTPYKHGDIEGYTTKTAPIYTTTEYEYKGTKLEFQDYNKDGWMSCMDCHAFIGNGWTMGNRPNEMQEMFMGQMGLNYRAYDKQMTNAFDVIANFEDYAREIPEIAWFLDEGYHLVIDVCSFIAYLICPFSYGIGCVVSVALDVLNAYLYVEYKDDYYSAGMQLAFAVVPGGEAIKYTVKSPVVKKALGNFFKRIWGNGDLANAMKAAKEEILTLPIAARKEIKEVFGDALPYLRKGTDLITDGFRTMKRQAKRYLPNSAYKLLKNMIDTTTVTFRSLVYALEIFVYDPGLPADLIEFLAGKNSFSDWLNRLPKVGLKIWSNMLASADNFKAAMETTPYDCTGKVFVWFETDMKDDSDVSIQKSWLRDGYSEKDFTEERVWEEWKNGWRPDALTNDVILIYHMIERGDIICTEKATSKLMEKYDTYLKSCMAFVQAMNSQKEETKKDIYMLFSELGCTETDVDEVYKTLDPEN